MVHQQSSNVIFVITIILIKSSLVLGNKPEQTCVFKSNAIPDFVYLNADVE